MMYEWRYKTLPKRYENFYHAICDWNKKKNFTTFKQLFKFCGEDNATTIQKLWFIVKNTLNGRYKEIEKYFAKSVDK